MATPTGTLAMEVMERIRRDIDKMLFVDGLTQSIGVQPKKTLTQVDVRGWIQTAAKLRAEYVPPMAFIIQDAQQQRRTPVVGWYYERPQKLRTKTRKRGRKCSRRKWKAMNRRQWVERPVYAEPDDVLQFQGKTLVTPRQHQALVDATIRINSTN